MALKLKKNWPWIIVPLFLLGVFICVNMWDNSSWGTAVLFMFVMLGVFVAVRLLLRREGLCRDAKSAAIVLVPFCALILARLSMFDYATLDYQDFLHPWVERLRELGGFAGLDEPIGNYNIPYMTWLAFFSYIPVHDLYLIKLLSVLFDVALAYFLAKLTGTLTDEPSAKVMSFLLVLILPTPSLNGAVWGQCDSSYAALGAAALYFALRTPKRMQTRDHYMRFNSIMCYTCAALALGYKLQTVFILPIFIPLLIAKKIRLRYIWVFPAVYILSISPALIAGRGFIDTLTIYMSELGTAGDGLNYNSPSMFALFWEWSNPEMWEKLGIVFAAAVCVLVFYFAYFRRKKLDAYLILVLTAILAVGVPMFLPHMHDRYFYLADVLILPLAAIKFRYAPAVLLCGFASLLGYYAYLRMQWLMTMNYGFYALVVVFVMLIVMFVCDSRSVKLKT